MLDKALFLCLTDDTDSASLLLWFNLYFYSDNSTQIWGHAIPPPPQQTKKRVRNILVFKYCFLVTSCEIICGNTVPSWRNVQFGMFCYPVINSFVWKCRLFLKNVFVVLLHSCRFSLNSSTALFFKQFLVSFSLCLATASKLSLGVKKTSKFEEEGVINWITA